jgi:hypothetical protein
MWLSRGQLMCFLQVDPGRMPLLQDFLINRDRLASKNLRHLSELVRGIAFRGRLDGNFAMLTSMIRVIAATAAFGVMHSALASRRAKGVAANAFGERNRNGLYRVFYLAQSAGTFAIWPRISANNRAANSTAPPPSLALLMHAIQAGAAVYAISAAKQVGVSRILGARRLRCWLGKGFVRREPEAQGPDRMRCRNTSTSRLVSMDSGDSSDAGSSLAIRGGWNKAAGGRPVKLPGTPRLYARSLISRDLHRNPNSASAPSERPANRQQR